MPGTETLTMPGTLTLNESGVEYGDEEGGRPASTSDSLTCTGVEHVCVCWWLTPFSRQPRSGLLGPAANELMQQIICPCWVVTVTFQVMTM
jgi:hypothetical protein